MQFWQVDAFTTKPLHGNPAAVFVLDDPLSDELQQMIAREMNLSETAFVLGASDQLQIRWFTPNSEVDLCGHATIAAAHILSTEGFIKSNQLEFSSRSGPLGVRIDNGKYTLNFPAQPGTERLDLKAQVIKILGEPPQHLEANGRDLLVVIDDPEKVRTANPKLELIRKLEQDGFLLTAQSGNRGYVYRSFFPSLDVPEDPVCGSANTLLAPYWSKTLGKETLEAEQVSARGGKLTLKLIGDRVEITGPAVTVIEGTLML